MWCSAGKDQEESLPVQFACRGKGGISSEWKWRLDMLKSNGKDQYSRVLPALVVNAVDVATILVVWVLDLAVENFGFVEELSAEAQHAFLVRIHRCHDVVWVVKLLSVKEVMVADLESKVEDWQKCERFRSRRRDALANLRRRKTNSPRYFQQ